MRRKRRGVRAPSKFKNLILSGQNGERLNGEFSELVPEKAGEKEGGSNKLRGGHHLAFASGGKIQPGAPSRELTGVGGKRGFGGGTRKRNKRSSVWLES